LFGLNNIDFSTMKLGMIDLLQLFPNSNDVAVGLGELVEEAKTAPPLAQVENAIRAIFLGGARNRAIVKKMNAISEDLGLGLTVPTALSIAPPTNDLAADVTEIAIDDIQLGEIMTTTSPNVTNSEDAWVIGGASREEWQTLEYVYMPLVIMFILIAAVTLLGIILIALDWNYENRQRKQKW
jgi:hypothetical protein